MARRDDVLRKLQRQEAAEPAPDSERAPAETPKGHPPALGTSKVTLNIRTAIWRGGLDAEGIVEIATNAGVTPVAVIEALLERYINDEKFQDRINNDAANVMRDRRRLAAEIRAQQRRQGQT